MGRSRGDVDSLNTTDPEFAFRAPAMIASAVDLPAPLGPIKPVIAPVSTSNEAPSTACTPPNALCMSSTDRIGCRPRLARATNF